MRLDYELKDRFVFDKKDILDFRLHAQADVEIVFMTGGTCDVTCGSAEYTIGAGDVFIAFPNQPHSYMRSREVEAWLLIVPVNSLLSAYRVPLMKHCPVCPVLRAGQWDREALLPLIEMAYRDRKRVTEPVMQGYLMVIVGKLLGYLQLQEQLGGAEQALRQVLGYINDHYRSDLTRSQIARAVGYNESYVSHLFTGTMHTTLPEYIHSLRMDDACRMLLETDMTVTRLASELGYGSIRNFNRVFVSHTGMTPRQYRTKGK